MAAEVGNRSGGKTSVISAGGGPLTEVERK